ncbi:MAG TPA: DsbA family protein [Patescibacteria group bacterium]|nr:DsbA family protein [Patescibacteria group bacterium]
MKDLKKYLPVIIFLVVIVVAAIILFVVTGKKTNTVASNNQTQESEQTPVPKETSDAIPNLDQKWVKGNPNGKVQIIEYSDFQCPYCKKGNDTIEEMYNKYKDDMQVTFVHFPLTSIHPYALPAARAAEAAGVMGKFWEMHELLFANQNNLKDEDFYSYAKKLGLDLDQFKKIYVNKNILDKINKQVADLQGKQFDEIALDDSGKIIEKGKTTIQGTPAFLINGKLVVGAYPAEEFEKFIQNAMK